MFCNQCGNELSEGSKFCNSCGAPVNPVENKETQSTATASSKDTPTPISVPGPEISKSTKKKANPLVMVAVVLIAFLLGRFVIAPALTSNSDKDDSKKESKKTYAETNNQIKGYKTQYKSFQFSDSSSLSSHLGFVYKVTDDKTNGDIVSISGFFMVADKDTALIDALAQQFSSLENTLKKSNYKKHSIELKNDGTTLNFNFTEMDTITDDDVLKAISKLIGHSSREETLKIDAVEKSLSYNGYTLRE